MYEPLAITMLNDFIFCPASIYFHSLYGMRDKILYQTESQINGTSAHRTIDEQQYSDRKEILSAIYVYSEEYGLYGKIDLFNTKTGELRERKRTIKKIYDGYVFQVYAQCFALREMGYTVNKIFLYSITDNKNYPVALPEENEEMKKKFEQTIEDIHHFQMDSFIQDNPKKCENCIYEPACDRGIKDD